VLGVGAVITIEPGIYIPGFGGVRIEDLAVVEEGRARILSRSTKDLLEL
jgi:Xaa-Pro aminopeptidase